MSSAEDYAWFQMTDLGLAVGSCLTFVKDVPDLSEEEPDPGDPRWVFDEQAAGRALALAHHVTGIRLTEDTLTQPVYLAVSVPATRSPGADETVPPLYFHDVEPTVDQPETMDLDGTELIVAAIGQPLTVRPFAQYGYDFAIRYTVHSVLQAPHADPQPDEADSVWLLVDVEAVGVRGPVDAAPHDFAFVAADRSRYWPVGIGDKPQLEITSLQAGERASSAEPSAWLRALSLRCECRIRSASVERLGERKVELFAFHAHRHRLGHGVPFAGPHLPQCQHRRPRPVGEFDGGGSAAGKFSVDKPPGRNAAPFTAAGLRLGQPGPAHPFIQVRHAYAVGLVLVLPVVEVAPEAIAAPLQQPPDARKPQRRDV
ncbi:hypothetical protein [Actinoplanes sp. NPDC026619]|uniref:hypothetical protein n=1 Tax=Actinoplanes sp. NPDC026619 TaxID=3155798 RepID=UPI0033CC68E9